MRNQRRLGRPINIEEEASLWHGAIERKLDGCFLQIVGLGSPTSTAFTRILINERSSLGSSTSRDVAQPPLPQFTLNHVVDVVLEAARLDHEVPLNGGDLIRLGSVWLLPNSTCDWIARRLSAADINAVPEDWLCVTLRIHYNPPRFPSSWRVSDAIVHEVSLSSALDCISMAGPNYSKRSSYLSDIQICLIHDCCVGQRIWLHDPK